MRKFVGIAAVVALLAVIVFVVIYLPARRQTDKKTPLLVPASGKLEEGEVRDRGRTDKIAPPTLAIMARIDGAPWKRVTAVYPLKAQKVTLRVNKVPGGNTRWYQIVPDISKIYKNANHPWEANPYKWVGFAKIDYSRRELTGFRGQWEIQPFSEVAETRHGGNPTEALSLPTAGASDALHYHKDVGSFWFQVEVEKDGKALRSPGIEDSDKKGLSPGVFRVSVRDGKGYLGYLTTFFNVPGVFGSVPYQSNNYIGADCCDALVAAYGIWAGKKFTKDYSVSMLVSQLHKVLECEIVNGKPDRRIEWGKEIHPGNFIAVKYQGASRYQHIGALYTDADKDGVLSEGDIVLHAGPLPLHRSTLGEGFFDGHVLILEPKLSKLASSDQLLVRVAREIVHLFR